MITAKGLKKLCDDNGFPYSGRLPELVRKAAPAIRRFCRKYNLSHVATDVTAENTNSRAIRIEPLYFFSDNLGGYTADAIRGSL